MLCDGDDGVLKRTPHPSGISTTNMFSLRYACDNMGLCVRSYRDADGALSSDFLKGWRESVRCYATATTAYLPVLLGAIATQMALYPTDLL